MSLLNFFRKDFVKSDEVRKLFDLVNIENNLLSQNKYISKREYEYILKDNKNLLSYFDNLEKSGYFKKYCKSNHVTIEEIYNGIEKIKKCSEIFDQHNKEFVEYNLIRNKEYLDNILKEIDSQISLDNEQRRVVLEDEDYTLVIAGAGSGKTTTMAAKVKYLIEKCDIRPEEILVISFTNKAVMELKDKINKKLKYDVPISTFHSVGNAIIHKNNNQLKNIVDSNKIYFVLQEYFKRQILIDKSLMRNLILFFSDYFDVDKKYDSFEDYLNDLSNSYFTTMKSELNDYCREIIDKRNKKKKTINLEFVKSQEEVRIANFLYMNNIEYIYEPVYRYNITFSNKPYTPDFMIKQGNNIAYIEHFGITEDGNSNLYTEDELNKYKKFIKDKIKIHKIHKTNLIYTFSKYKDNRDLIEHLKEELLKNNFVLYPKNEQEVVKKIMSDEENKYIAKLMQLIVRFIQLFKVNGYETEKFNEFFQSSKNERTKLFLSICKQCYLEYQRYLTVNNSIDFDDMINDSSRILKDVKEVGQKIKFKYIIVDEYQDISMQRFDLVKALHEVCDAKIIAVGDDFQSIFSFAGSDIELFTDFKNKFGYANVSRIINTYRNSQELIDIAGKFIEKNKMQIYKDLRSPKHIEYPIVVNCFQKCSRIMENAADAVEKALDDIVKNSGISSNVLLLGRFGFDGYKLSNSDKFTFVDYGSKIISNKYPNLKINFMTVHASKGLGYDNVIILNMNNGNYGFPSKIENDPVLSLVINEDKNYKYAEERRLFYVALTRTKNRVYLVTPTGFSSDFLSEIINENSNIKINGDFKELEFSNAKIYKKCPYCGYPMQYRYKESFGLPLFICMNDSELCGFMTNEYSAGKMEIVKCNKCIDGYLICKKGNNNTFFLGCTNYKKDGTGCNNIISEKEIEYRNHNCF